MRIITQESKNMLNTIGANPPPLRACDLPDRAPEDPTGSSSTDGGGGGGGVGRVTEPPTEAWVGTVPTPTCETVPASLGVHFTLLGQSQIRLF